MKVYNGDLRDKGILPENSQFDVITGTPPYFKEGEGALSAKIDQKACLFEFRGGVEAYIEAAHRYLKDQGRFVVVESALGQKRIDESCKVNGMRVVERWDFIPKEGKRPLFVIAVLEKSQQWKDYEIKKVTIRNAEGKYTQEYHKLLQDMGFPPQREAEDFVEYCVC